MASMTAAQLVRIARLRRFVGVFARGGDREATAEALLELSRAARASGLQSDAIKRARQAAEVLGEDVTGETGIRSLLQLSSLCLDLGDAEAAVSAANVVIERATALPEPARSELIGSASLIAGVAHAALDEVHEARSLFDEARERFVASRYPEGAALALAQLGILDAEAGRFEAADVCFTFARDFYRASTTPQAAAEIGALAVRALAAGEHEARDRWFGEAIADADRVKSHALAAELVVERAEDLEREGAIDDAIQLASEAARRTAQVAEHELSRRLMQRARILLARRTAAAADALRHADAAFEYALDLLDPAALAESLELVVTGLVNGRFTPDAWHLVDRFRDRLANAGFDALAQTAVTALELRPEEPAREPVDANEPAHDDDN